MSGLTIENVSDGIRLSSLIKNEVNSFFRFFNFEKLTLFANQQLYCKNGAPTHIYYIQDGLIRLCEKGRLGKDNRNCCASAGSFLGINNVVYNTKYTQSAIAVQDTEIIAITRKNFLDILYTQTEASKYFIVFLCKLLYAADKNIYEKNLIHMKRVAETILILYTNSDLQKRGNSLKVTFDDIHHLTGIPEPIIENTLNDLINRQLVCAYRKTIKTVDVTGLKKLIHNN